MNKDFYFNFSVSVKQYDRNKDDAAFLQWKEVNGNITMLSDYITEGYAYCNTFYHEEGKTFSNKLKKENNAKSANLICIDLDAVKYPYNEFVATMEQTEIMPNIVYTTANNGKFKKPSETYNNRYRVIYVVDEPIYNNALYKEIHQAIKREIELITEDENVFNDNTDNNISHFFAGAINTTITTDENIYPLSCLMKRYGISSDNEKVQCECIYTDNGKSIIRCNNTKYQADVYIGEDMETDIDNNTKYQADVYLKKERRVLYNRLIFQDVDFKNDILTLPLEQIIIKYQNIYNTDEHTNIEFEDNELYKYLPADYLEIRRKWNFENMNVNGKQINISKALKIKNGEGRRKTIFLNLILRKRINPNITIEHLLYNGLRELYYYIDNTDKDDVITTYEISRMAYEVFNTDINKWKFKANTKKFKINKDYCKKNGINARSAALQVNRDNLSKEKQNKIEQIKVLYDSEISDQENINVFGENGVNISMATFRRYKKEMGLSKTYNKRPQSAQKQKDNEVIETTETSTERANKMPIIENVEHAQEMQNKDTATMPQETPNKSVESVENTSVEEIPMKEESSEESAEETANNEDTEYKELMAKVKNLQTEEEIKHFDFNQYYDTLKKHDIIKMVVCANGDTAQQKAAYLKDVNYIAFILFLQQKINSKMPTNELIKILNKKA